MMLQHEGTKMILMHQTKERQRRRSQKGATRPSKKDVQDPRKRPLLRSRSWLPQRMDLHRLCVARFCASFHCYGLNVACCPDDNDNHYRALLLLLPPEWVALEAILPGPPPATAHVEEQTWREKRSSAADDRTRKSNGEAADPDDTQRQASDCKSAVYRVQRDNGITAA